MQVSDSTAKAVIFGTIGVIAFFVILAALFPPPPPKPAPPVVACGPEDPTGTAAAELLLIKWKAGYSGDEVWALKSKNRKRLFNVTSFERLAPVYSVEGDPHASIWVFRVDSTTRGGIPVTQTWDFYVKQQGGSCRVYDLVQD